MKSIAKRAVAIVGLGAILPDAAGVSEFWQNVCRKRYSISETPADRWSVADYYSPDPSASDKTYSKIGGWVRGFEFDWKGFRVPPRVAAAMDQSQAWAVTASAQALADYGYPARPLDLERTAVVLGTAMGGEQHYLTHLRVAFPEYARALARVEAFGELPADVQAAILAEWQRRVGEALPPVTEDSMPGELPNVVSGRVANVLNLRGPNFITDAACASSFAAVYSALELLEKGDCEAVLAGGVDRNMAFSTFVKFCKIGALSATGTRPFGEGADGFVMGEGAGVFLLKRLEDAEAAGDRIYAVIRGVGGSSDGRGKGITAPNPQGQRLAVARAWQDAGLDPATATLIEAHGTSTKVGDVVEVKSLAAVFAGARRGSIALGSVKSNIGHLKAAAGAAGLLKATLAVCHGVLPPTLNAEKPNPNIDFAGTPFFLNHEAADWPRPADAPRRAGVSAYGFGGTNFHLVLEEHIPGSLTVSRAAVPGWQAAPDAVPAGYVSLAATVSAAPRPADPSRPGSRPAPLRGILALGAENLPGLQARLAEARRQVADGWLPPDETPDPAELAAGERLVVDFGTPGELAERLDKAGKALAAGQPTVWKALAGQGVFRGRGPRPDKLAFLFPGQGSQYLNMGRGLAGRLPVVAQVFAEANQVMTPILGRPLTEFIFCDAADPAAREQAERNLLQTAITQPAMLAMDIALYRLLAEYGFGPDLVMGHSLGEYAALIAAGVLPLADALEASAARGREMTRVSVADPGWMAAVMAPFAVIEQTLAEVDGYVVPANINSRNQCVIGGASQAVEQAIALFTRRGYEARRIPVSHAFHTEIVAPASKPLRAVLDRLHVTSPHLPVVANVTGALYPTDPDEIRALLERQVASPVQWVKGLETLYAAGARTFVEVGPKKALKGFTDDLFGDQPEVVSLFSNHPKTGEIVAFNQALCGLYAAGYAGADAARPADERPVTIETAGARQQNEGSSKMDDMLSLLTEALRRLNPEAPVAAPASGPQPYDRNDVPLGSVVITGTGLGLPGTTKPVMDPDNARRILAGEQFIDLVPLRFRNRMVAKNITRVVKSEDGSGSLETIESPDDVVRLAGRAGPFDLSAEYGVPEKLVEALDITTQLAMAAGLDALREAGIPLVQTYRRTSTGKDLPDRWLLPEALRDETGVIFASAFPGNDRFADELERYFRWQGRLDQLALLDDLAAATTDETALDEIARRAEALRTNLAREPYVFDRRFLFRVLAMGHSQMAEYIGARGPNTHVNAACASTAQAVALAEDWIRAGRCRRVLVVGADNVTSERLMEWIGAGFVATGAAATDDRVEEAALPFDRRRHGTIVGMGACALVIESEDVVAERGMRGIVELLSSETSNSAYHGTRLDVEHIAQVMNNLVTAAERRFGVDRQDLARRLVFMSHETFTPARGGSASAEVAALRATFGDAASEVVIANTKGFTGHAMGVGVEDVIAVKILEHGIVPPVPNFKEIDPELGALKLSRGGHYPVRYALHLAAGFGSQIALTLTRRIPGSLDRVDNKAGYRRWLADISGIDRAETEVVTRVLRVKAEAGPRRHPMASAWRYGTGPALRAPVAGDEARPAVYSPAPPPAGQTAPLPSVRPQSAPAGNGHGRVSGSGNGHGNGHGAAAAAEPPHHVVPNAPPVSAPVAPPPAAGEAPVAPIAEPVAGAPALVQEPPVTVAEGVAVPAVDPIASQVRSIVAAKTGYPEDMLDLDLDMEADLGIDTVKQAETFLAIREAFAIPRRDDLKLRDYPTLGRVIEFVYEMRPDLAPESGGSAATAQAVAAVPAQPAAPSASAVPLALPENGAASAGSAGQPALAADAAEAQAPAADAVTAQVRAIVAEKTGYPEDMLDLDLDMEADLGIDTVKQAETFLAIREAFAIPRRDDLKLRDYPTLGRVIEFVYEMRPDLAPGATQPVADRQVAAVEVAAADEPAPLVTEPAIAAAAATAAPLSDANLVPRRVPVAIVRPPLALCKTTGVQFGKGSRVVLAGDLGGVGGQLAATLAGLGVEVLSLDPAADAAAIAAQAQAWLAAGPIQGVYWLPGLDVEPELEQLDLAAWRAAVACRVKALYTLMRTLYGSVSGPGSFLVAGTRLGGLHGYGPDGATAPLGGAVTGFVKAYKRERPEVLVKVVDFAAEEPGAAVAEILLAETLADPATVEAGRRDGLRHGVSFAERPAPADADGLTLGKETIFVVTGAAGGITSAIVADLAAASGGTFYLLDLASAPAADDRQIVLFRQDKDALKQSLIDELKAAGERPTPAKIDKLILAVERRAAARAAVEAVEAAGGVAHYFSLNLLDGPAVAAVIDQIRAAHGRIDVLVHAGGLEISRSLPDKEPAEFDLVFDVKAEGFYNLLHAAQGLPIAATVVFSSIAGRFGNAGQTDYSAANDLLCKITSSLRRWRPETRGIAIDWTAWGGIGMATRGSIPRIMALAGIDLLPPQAGIPTVRRELLGGARGEVIVAGRLGILTAEADPAGGLAAVGANHVFARPLPMIGSLQAAPLYAADGLGAGALAAETTLDPTTEPFLFDHRFEGTALLPGVMGLEAFAELASLLAPGYHVAAIEGVRFASPFKFYRDQPRTLLLRARLAPAAGDALAAGTWLESQAAPRGQDAAQTRQHFTATVRLARQPAAAPAVDFVAPAAGALPITAEAIYQIYFHGPAYRVLGRAAVAGDTVTALLAEGLPADTAGGAGRWQLAPRLIEFCFQAAGLWQIVTQGALALPMALDAVSVYRRWEDAGGRRLYAEVTAKDEGEHFDARVVDEAGNLYIALAGYRTIRLPGSVKLAP